MNCIFKKGCFRYILKTGTTFESFNVEYRQYAYSLICTFLFSTTELFVCFEIKTDLLNADVI